MDEEGTIIEEKIGIVKKMRMAVATGDIEEAKKIGNMEIFEENGEIQLQMIKLEEKYGGTKGWEEIKKIGRKDCFSNDTKLHLQIMRIARKKAMIK